jgi:UDP-N-acetylmuramoyl-L-alanyl-D-glutamate--2,6-diaminopimelate ligase
VLDTPGVILGRFSLIAGGVLEGSIRLSALLRALPPRLLVADPPEQDPQVGGIQLDSRKLQPGELFVALGGTSVDGHLFIGDAARRGASVIFGSRPEMEVKPSSGLAIPYVQVSDGRLALAYLSAGFYRFPARKLVMIGVTGTDGKTTTCNLIYQILQAAGLPVGMISTVSARIGEEELDTGFHVTTPEAPDVQRYLAKMVEAGLTHVVLEATSHGLAQDRVGACDFDVGVVTNITHEHLDYHGSYAAYREAKARLFTGLGQAVKSLKPPHGAVLNRDDSSFEYLADLVQVPQVVYGFRSDADVYAEQIRSFPEGQAFTAVTYQGRFPVTTSLVGAFNISNCLAAIAATVDVLGLPVEAAQRGVAALKMIPGRMQTIEMGQTFTALVDFAHTPNALRRALETARQLAQAAEPAGRVIAVFGSAGLRDRLKRRMMAETSAELADLTVLTAEDPRSEALADILAEMASGARVRGAVEGRSFWRVPDRGEAVRQAVSLARPGDVVIVCGKGHEQSMCFGDVEYPWDDRVALRAALAELLGIPGPAMPYLPTQDSA